MRELSFMPSPRLGLSIRFKLFAVMVALCSVALVIAALSWWTVSRNQAGFGTVYYDRVVPLNRLAHISELYANGILGTATRLRAGRLQPDTAAETLRHALDAARDEWRWYLTTYLTPEETVVVLQVTPRMAAAHSTVDDVLLRHGIDGVLAFDASNLDRLELVIEPLLRQLRELADLQERVARKELERSQIAYEDMRGTLLVLICVGLSAMVIGFVTVNKQVLRPLRLAALIGHELAAGNASAIIPIPRQRNEFSEILRAFLGFREVLQQSQLLSLEHECKAQEFRSQLDAIFEHAPFGIFIKDIDGRFVMLNELAARALDKPIEGLIGRTIREVLPGEHGDMAHAADLEVLSTGQPVSREFHGNPVGTGEWLWTVKFPIRDQSGAISAIGGFEIDITARKHHEMALTRTATQLGHVQRIAGVVHWLYGYGPERRPTLIGCASEALRRLTGWDCAEVLETETYLDKCVHERDRERLRATYRAFEAEEIEGYSVEYRMTRADGSTMPVKVWVERIRQGGDTYVIGAMQDVSEQHEREQQLIDALKKAHLSESAKAAFLANMSHELRTPLNAIIGFSDLLRMHLEHTDNVKRVEYVDAIRASGNHLLQIITDILEASQPATEARGGLAETVFDVGEAITDCTGSLMQKAGEAGVLLKYRPDGAGIALSADRGAFRQSAINVLTNALKFTSSGGRVAVFTALNPAGELIIRISDTGCGIAPSIVPELTKPFTQAEGAYERRHNGVGLGLAIAKKLITAHGGRIEIQSELGQGTTVLLIYPRERVMASGG
jgi:PAS domain S-box-containing protein